MSAFLVGYFTYKSDAGDWRGWLKSIIFLGVGIYMLVNPAGGIATLGLLFSIYFFMDAFSGFTLAASFYPNKGWGIWAINAVLSLLMAMIDPCTGGDRVQGLENRGGTQKDRGACQCTAEILCSEIRTGYQGDKCFS